MKMQPGHSASEVVLAAKMIVVPKRTVRIRSFQRAYLHKLFSNCHQAVCQTRTMMLISVCVGTLRSRDRRDPRDLSATNVIRNGGTDFTLPQAVLPVELVSV